MKRGPKQPLLGDSHAPAEGADAIVQIKVWLLGISPMVWRRVLVPVSLTLRELHGVIQVAMGWEVVSRIREKRHAVPEMKVGPSEPSCRGRLQTAISCFGQKP